MARRKLTATLLALLLFTGCMTLAQDATPEPCNDESDAPTVDMTMYSSLDQLAEELDTDRAHVFAYADHFGPQLTEACNPDFEAQLADGGSASPDIWVMDGVGVDDFLATVRDTSAEELQAIYYPWCMARVNDGCGDPPADDGGGEVVEAVAPVADDPHDQIIALLNEVLARLETCQPGA